MNGVQSMYDLKRLCMPYNISDTHWVAICCDFFTLTITLIDSMAGIGHAAAMAKLKTFLESKFVAGSRQVCWRVVIRADAQCRQIGGVDCGLFTLAHVTLCALQKEDTGLCSQSIVSHMRERVYHDLIVNGINF